MSETETKIQWHPGFVAAMNLELEENKDDLIFEDEYNLNTRPLEIDLLIIKKTSDIKIKNEIGAFFREYNVMEYKAPGDSLNVDVMYKVLGYAALYKSYGETVDAVKAEDITVSLVREGRPEGLFEYLKRHDIKMSNPIEGIYYLEDKFLFPVQIIVGVELDKESHIWLKALTDKMQKQDMKKFLEEVSRITEKGKRELADSVLEVSARANKALIELLRKEGDIMSGALMEIFEPEINEIVDKKVSEIVDKKVREIADNKQIARLIVTARQYGASENQIVLDISSAFDVSEEDAGNKIKEFDEGLITV